MQVKEIRDSESVCIYELDYGKTKVVHSSVLQPLVMEFRELPFQAVVAQLAGMRGLSHQPSSWRQSIHWQHPPTGVTESQWSEEASMLFRTHVEHRALVAKVERLSDVKGYLWNCRLSVYLVDTSLEDKDIWIHSLMADISGEPSTAWWDVLSGLGAPFVFRHHSEQRWFWKFHTFICCICLFALF